MRQLSLTVEEIIYKYLYCDNSISDIAKICNCSMDKIKSILINNNIKLRNIKEARNLILKNNRGRMSSAQREKQSIRMKKYIKDNNKKIYISKEDLIHYYIELELATTDIGKIFNISYGTVAKLLKENDIPLRNRKECHNTKVYSQKLSSLFKGKNKKGHPHTSEFKNNMSIRMRSIPKEVLSKRLHTYENDKNNSERLKKFWSSNSEESINLRQKMMLSQVKSPNKIEQKINNLLNILYPNEWKYVGNGEVIIGGLNPDFINVNGKKIIIEVFGDYFHDPSKKKNLQWHRTELGRIMVYNSVGFKTLIIWEHELKDENNVSNKIKEFVESYKPNHK